MHINSTIFLTIVSFFYSLLLIIVYFPKKKIKSLENNIYSKLIIINFIGIVLELLCCLFAGVAKDSLLFYTIINKTFLIYLIVWCSIFGIYVFLISSKIKEIDKLKKYIKKISKIYLFLNIIFIIFVILSPLQFQYNNGYVMYSYGKAVDMVFLVSFLFILLMFFCLFKNFKNLKSKKYMPIYVYLLFGTVVGMLQKIYPNLLMFTSMEAFITIMMYFTIENPDMKLINQLELAKNEADQANRAKSDFLSSMSHEIRTPLNAIVGFSQCIQNEKDEKIRNEEAADILMASQNLLEIVNGILDISKIEANKMEVVEANYELRPILDDLSKLMIPRIGEKNIKLVTNFAPDIPSMLYGDKGKVKQIITNLLTNAVKYTEQGIINFDVKCVNEKDISKLIIIVKDTGRGIKNSQMNNLFNKFQRLDEDKNTTIEGTGLGLAITKSLVEMIGGKIIVQSEYGKGSIFTVYLPQKIVDSSGYKELKKEDASIITFKGKKILVVDDNNLNLKVINRIFKPYEMDVTLVFNGQECIDRINNNENYDLIFMDIMMPHMSGLETLKRLKNTKNFNTPVIALTADAIQGKSTKYIESGFNEYLSKPIDSDILKKILIKYLSDKKELKNIDIKEEKIDSGIKKVLIVDDNKLNIKIAIRMLEEYNFNIESVTSGQECIGKIKNGDKYDLIFLDDMMPKLSGPETLKELKKDSSFKTPVISLTANKEQTNTREYYLNLGFDEYIGKPIDRKILKEVINKLIDIKK